MGSYSGDRGGSSDDNNQVGDEVDENQTSVDDFTEEEDDEDGVTPVAPPPGSGSAAGAGAAGAGAAAGAAIAEEVIDTDKKEDEEKDDDDEEVEAPDIEFEEEPEEKQDDDFEREYEDETEYEREEQEDIEEPEEETEEEEESEDEEDEEDDEEVEVDHKVDPLSAMSWGVQPVIKRVQERYRDQVEINYQLAPVRSFEEAEKERQKWVDSSNKHSMPVNPEFWDEPPESTELVNKAFVAALKQGQSNAINYLRSLWIEGIGAGRNIASREALTDLAENHGLDVAQFEEDLDSIEPYTGREPAELPLTVMEIKDIPNPLQGKLSYSDFRYRFIFEGMEEQPLRPLEEFISDHGPVSTEEVREVYELEGAEEAVSQLQQVNGITSRRVGGTRFWQL